MAMQYIKKTQKFGGVRVYDPNQKGIAVTHEFKGQPFVFFNNKRGMIIGKGVRPTYDQYGELVSDYTWEEVVEHFKGMGFKVEDLDAKKPEPKKEVKKEAPKKGILGKK